MVVVLRPPEFIDRLQFVLPLIREAVEEQVLVERPFQAALGTGAVIAGDVDEQRVVSPRQLLDGVDDAAHLEIDTGPVAGEHLHHAGVEPLLVGVQRIPRRQPCGAYGQLRLRRDDAELFCRAIVSSRYWSQPMSNLPLNLSIHSFGTWWGAWVAPGAT